MPHALMTLTSDQIIGWIAHYFWPFCRIGGFFLIVPILGTRLVPSRVRLLLALTLTLLVAPSIDVMPLVSPLSVEGITIIAQQILIGLVMGFMVQILFQICVIGGQMIAMQNGLGFSTLLDPVNGINVASIAQLYLMSSNLMFLAFNGHLWLIKTLCESFYSLPIGTLGVAPDDLFALVEMGSWLFASGLLVALPAVTALLLVNIAFGVMSKVAPQMNIFSIGFPFTMVFGLVIIWISMTSYLPQFEQFTDETFGHIEALIKRP